MDRDMYIHMCSRHIYTHVSRPSMLTALALPPTFCLLIAPCSLGCCACGLRAPGVCGYTEPGTLASITTIGNAVVILRYIAPQQWQKCSIIITVRTKTYRGRRRARKSSAAPGRGPAERTAQLTPTVAALPTGSSAECLQSLLQIPV